MHYNDYIIVITFVINPITKMIAPNLKKRIEASKIPLHQFAIKKGFKYPTVQRVADRYGDSQEPPPRGKMSHEIWDALREQYPEQQPAAENHG